MPGPRKVRIFRDKRKSPNWYVEWRDMEGKRHCESCGPRRQDAEQRSGSLEVELRRLRSVDANANREGAEPTPENRGSPAAVFPGSDTAARGPVVQVRASVQVGQSAIPVDLQIEITPELLKMFGQMIADAEAKRP